jgi:hypothetical protein
VGKNEGITKKQRFEPLFFLLILFLLLRLLRCGGTRVLESVLEALTGFEFGDRDGRDLDFFRRVLWVHTRAALACFGHEAAEPRDSDFATLLECFDHGGYEGFDHVFGLFFGDADFFREERDEFRFVHIFLVKRIRS